MTKIYSNFIYIAISILIRSSLFLILDIINPILSDPQDRVAKLFHKQTPKISSLCSSCYLPRESLNLIVFHQIQFENIPRYPDVNIFDIREQLFCKENAGRFGFVIPASITPLLFYIPYKILPGIYGCLTIRV